MNLENRAKYLANEDLLRIIFVSSEGHVMPLIESTSSVMRASPVVEVVDIPDEEEGVMGKELAKEVVAYTGGRIIQLLAGIPSICKLTMK